MSRNYKMLDKEGMYFISFATINWIDVFVRQQYFELICESLNYCVKEYQFWQQHNHPIELWSNKVIDQKIDYIHNNPVEAGFVEEPHYWKYSSAIDYCGTKGEVDVCLV